MKRPAKRRKAPAVEPRFSDCAICKHFKPNNTASACQGCEVGENFEEEIAELDPYSERFLPRREK